MKRRVILALLSAVLLLSLVGCGGESPAVSVLGHTDQLVSMDKLSPVTGKGDPGYQLELPREGEEIAVITMSTGETIKLRFFPEEAPKAVYNFKVHAIEGYYDGLTFHRISENFMIQGGDPSGTGREGESVWKENFADEFQPNLFNIDGAVSMANRGADTNSSQFFINCTNGAKTNWENYEAGFSMYQSNPDSFTSNYGRWIRMDLVSDEMKALYDAHGGNPFLDGYYSTTGEGHTVFAQVFEGMDTVVALSRSEVDEDGETPLTPIVIEKVEIVTY